ncbi:perlucin-like protein [Argopecten irradians]|uniref:perlucin-like protein n=1 Tax=Argopecten irradians TaxID=31199 RepID=UPI0037244964
MVFTVHLYLILIPVFIQVVRGCPNGWTEYRHSCYMAFFDKQDWSAASTTCHEKHAYLAEVADEQENDFLKELVARYHNHSNYWLGGSDIFVEGDWRWGESDKFINYTNWRKGEPNNHHTHGEDCLQAHYNGERFQWMDAQCTVNNNYICEQLSGTWIPLG